MTTIIIAIIAALIGALVTALIMQQRHQAVQTRADVLEAQLQLAQEQAQVSRQETEKQLAQQKEEAERLLLAQKQETERQHRESLEMQQRQFDETMAKVSAQLKNTTDEMLKQRQKEFSEASTANLGQIVNPLRETIDKMKQAMADNTEKQTAMGGEMKANLEQMIRQSEAARKSAKSWRAPSSWATACRATGERPYLPNCLTLKDSSEAYTTTRSPTSAMPAATW